jgi:hypothetical protein
MAGYEPIRDSFRELNRLVIDSTTWDERHAATAASNRRQEMMDRNTMAQQEWSNSMAERKMVLDERGEKRLSDKLSADMAHMSIMEDIALTKVGQDERKLKDQLATNAKQRELLSLELDEKLYETEAVDLNVSGLLTPKELQSETVLGNINAGPQFGGSGRTLGPDGFVRDEFGEVVKMRRKDQVELAPILQGAGAKMDLNTGM